MSERGSFTTQYVYCEECLERLKAVLCKNDKSLKGVQIPSWRSDEELLPIIAGKCGGLGAGDERLMFEHRLFNSENAPCHPVVIAVIPETTDPVIFLINPDGTARVKK